MPANQITTNESWWYYLGQTYYRYDVSHTLTKSQSSPSYYKFTWSGPYSQQAWVELDLSTGKMRCYFYIKRYGDNVYIEALSVWKPFTYYGQFGASFNEWEILTNANEALVTVSIPCQV
ncbi:MAG: hypothetical protein H5U08_00730 [Thermogutta sp.]|uniref:hypothetical protein n=1 Tax=Thermogutta sp. TaxID=1962930 RepID=UPI0019864D83|nr:hypothetical protein [Thermogutta sp.]MBC7350860.1 hypothetical protein [Thermogutta sp.]